MMQMSDTRVTARVQRTEEGEVRHEYLVDDIAYGSIEALEAALGGA